MSVEADAPTFSSRILKAGALLGDVRRVVEVWDDGLSSDENLDRIVEGNLLGKPSRSRGPGSSSRKKSASWASKDRRPLGTTRAGVRPSGPDVGRRDRDNTGKRRDDVLAPEAVHDELGDGHHTPLRAIEVLDQCVIADVGLELSAHCPDVG